MVQQKMVTLSSRRQVIPVGVAEARKVRARKGPDHPALSDDLLFGRGMTAAHRVIGQQIAAVNGVLRRVEPVGQDFFRQLRPHLSGRTGKVGRAAARVKE